MSADATNASDLPSHLPAAPASPNLAERTEHVAAAIEHAAIEVWNFLRLSLFVVYLLVAILAFWLWVISAVIGLLRLGLKALMAVLLWLSGGTAPRPGPPAASMAEGLKLELDHWWDKRVLLYEELSRPLARQLLGAQRATRTFWHWRLFRKVVAVTAMFWLVVVPAMYVVPRPHEVQITDDNAVAYDKVTNKTTYLVHALDMHIEDKTREYINEDAWYLGKINSQGLKSQLQIGRTYRLWVVGVRWYYMPTLYPNIISATEIDDQGNVVKVPKMLANPAAPQLPAAKD